MAIEDKLYIASDHAGFELKNKLKEYLSKYPAEDLGPYNYDKEDDYPDYAAKLARKIQETNGKGILVCGSGQGMCRVADKFKGIYSALAWNEETARIAKEHGNANVLCLAGGFTDYETAKRIVDVWLGSEFKGGRHERRMDKIKSIEKENMK